MHLGELQMAKTVTMRMRREAIFWSLFCRSVCFALIRLDNWKENGRSLRTFFWGWENYILQSLTNGSGPMLSGRERRKTFMILCCC